jgi:hypothetical protein
MLIRFPIVTTLLIPRFDGGGGAATVVDSSAQKLLQGKVNDLERDNRKFRERLREYRALGTAEEIKAKLEKVPADGTVAVSADDAKALKAYQELGKPEELKTKIELGVKATMDLAERDRRESALAACRAAGINPEALLKLPGADKLKFEVKKEKVDGKDVDVAYVTDTAVQGAAPKKLTEHVEATWPEFQSALQAEADSDQQPRRTTGTTTFPVQRPARSGKEKAPTVEETVERKSASGDYSVL